MRLRSVRQVAIAEEKDLELQEPLSTVLDLKTR